MDLIASRISIPANVSYIQPVTAFAIELARYMGFDEEEVSHIHLALEESLNNVIEFGYGRKAEETFEVVFEPQARGIVIRIKEKGIPFNPERLPEYRQDRPDLDVTGAGLGLHLIKSYMDETSFVRKGRAGQEILLTKHMKNKHINNLMSDGEKSILSETSSREKSGPGVNYTIRPMKPEEAVEVSKCAYQCYGYTYEDYIYYPERVAAMNEDGLLYSLVAVTEDNRIMGHSAMKRERADAAVAECGVAFIYPEFRRLGLFTKFNGLFIEHAGKIGLQGLFGRAATSHVASQRMSAGHGYKDCGIYLGIYFDDVNFKKIAGQRSQRESCVLSFLAIQKGEPRNIYLSGEYRSLAERIFHYLDVPVRFPSDNPDGGLKSPENYHLDTTRHHALNIAEMLIHGCGTNILDEIRHQLKTLCLERTDVINAVLNIEDPTAGALVPELESLGFFFSGILPFGIGNRHALILQYLNNLKMDLDCLNVVSPEGSMILDLIKETM